VLTAVITDDLGAVTTSDAVSIAVDSGVAQVYYIYADHLNTPRLIEDQNRKAVWMWDQTEPFGNNGPDEDPKSMGSRVVFNLRFPGQYFDEELGTFYNYHRNYMPDLNRYVESDPIGIRGGINIYAYVSDPLTQIDPLGLMGFGGGANIHGPRPGTGNIWPGAPQQNFICDFPLDLLLENNPCTQQCCVDHDKCFQRNKCNWSSWFGNIFIGTTFPCNQCNTAAKNCVVANWGRTPPNCSLACWKPGAI
jgi:RHS repeat-associated protein